MDLENRIKEGIEILEMLGSEETETLRKEFEEATKSVTSDTKEELINLKTK